MIANTWATFSFFSGLHHLSEVRGNWFWKNAAPDVNQRCAVVNLDGRAVAGCLVSRLFRFERQMGLFGGTNDDAILERQSGLPSF